MSESELQKRLRALVDQVTKRQASSTGAATLKDSSPFNLESLFGSVADKAGSKSDGENVFTSIAKKTFTLAPVVSGLVKLFSGGGTPEPPPLIYYQPPAPVRIQGAITGADGEIRLADYGQNERVRILPGQALPPINVQVQAIDSRSFLDHSDEIARAVREALLNSHALGDVIQEL